MHTPIKAQSYGLLLVVLGLLAACTRTLSTPPAAAGTWTPLPVSPSATPIPIYTLPPTRGPGTPIAMPTPDAPHPIPTPRGEIEHVVQFGETLGSIAQGYAISQEALMTANGLDNPNVLAAGQVLRIPAEDAESQGPSLKSIPDSELVYGPYARIFDTRAFVQAQDGFLAHYTETVGDETLDGAAIVDRVAQDYSVNPRLLLALLEYRAGWVTEKAPAKQNLPIGIDDGWHVGLYRQLTWTANELNRGYYLWKVDAVNAWQLADGNFVRPDARLNAGTAALQHVFARLDDAAQWRHDLSLEGFLSTYMRLFGYPFDVAIEPLIPPDLTQPALRLPFAAGETWYFTGGPHGGWDEGSAWAALDFAPPDAEGCNRSAYLVRASADGVIVRADHGAVVQDLDGDGYPQTGWTLLYMHIAADSRVQVGDYVHAGEVIGRPSCEGGFANGTHVHLARRYNGEWIAADGAIPFVLDGWVAAGDGVAYDGTLQRNGVTVEAWDAKRPENRISR